MEEKRKDLARARLDRFLALHYTIASFRHCTEEKEETGNMSE